MNINKYINDYHEYGEDRGPYKYEFEACIDCNCPTETACMMSITTDRCPKMHGWRKEQDDMKGWKYDDLDE